VGFTVFNCELPTMPQAIGSRLMLSSPALALSSPTKTVASNDVGLVNAAIAGDRRAWSELYDRYVQAVHGCILAKVPPIDAEDLTQDVFVFALARLETLADPKRFGGWLMTIARNRRTDYWRRHKDSKEFANERKSEQAPLGDAQRALDAIRSLPDAYQEPLIMRFVEGMTGPEIARCLDMKHGAVRVNLSRGMKLLRDALNVKESV
jgi:RNA polymerase sigma-70 factor (ECF subfamily)